METFCVREWCRRVERDKKLAISLILPEEKTCRVYSVGLASELQVGTSTFNGICYGKECGDIVFLERMIC